MDRFELAKSCLDKGLDELAKQHSMAELQALFCRLVKAPQAPKFSDKKCAAKRVLAMATEVSKSAPVPVPELNEVFGLCGLNPVKPDVKRGRGRPKAGPRTYYFLDPGGKNVSTLPKQARMILDHVVHGVELGEDDLREQVYELAADGKLATKQDPWRIFLYYRAKLIARGVLRMQYV